MADKKESGVRNQVSDAKGNVKTEDKKMEPIKQNVPVKDKEKKVEAKENTEIAKEKVEDKKMEDKKEVKTEGKVEVKPKEKVKVEVKDIAIANGFALKISPKQCKYSCRVIRGKSPEAAVARLQAVIDEKRPVPMAGLEVGHKKGKGLAGGKFPKNACRGIMEIVKQAAANAVVAGIENPIIAIAKSDRAAAPFRRAGRKAKRAHIYIEIRSLEWMKVNGRLKGKGGKK